MCAIYRAHRKTAGATGYFFHTQWSIPQPAAVLRVCRFEGNLVWGFTNGAVEADGDSCYLLRYSLIDRTCWPLCSAADYLFTGREKYVSHYKHWRLIAVFLLQRSVSDWPVVEIIASLVVWGSGSHTQDLSVWLPTPGPSAFISRWVFGSLFYSSLHMQICLSGQHFLSLVEAEFTMISLVIELKVGLCDSQKVFVQHYSTFRHPKMRLSLKVKFVKRCHSFLTFIFSPGWLVQMLPLIKNGFRKLQTQRSSFVPISSQIWSISFVPCQMFIDKPSLFFFFFGRLLHYLQTNVRVSDSVCLANIWV